MIEKNHTWVHPISKGHAQKVGWCLPYIYVPITLKCTRNCESCIAFAPLANKHPELFPFSHVSLERFRRGIEHLKSWMGKQADDLSRFDISGGEPTIHPQFDEILLATRATFPKTEICIRTNGNTIKTWEDKGLWKLLSSTHTILEITNYGNLHFPTLQYFSEKEKVPYVIHNFGAESVTFFKSQLTQHKNNFLGEREFKECGDAAECRTFNLWSDADLLFPCSTPSYIWMLDKAFGTHFTDVLIEGVDCFDLSKHTFKETKVKLANSISFCGFCRRYHHGENVVITNNSKCDPQEWLDWTDLSWVDEKENTTKIDVVPVETMLDNSKTAQEVPIRF